MTQAAPAPRFSPTSSGLILLADARLALLCGGCAAQLIADPAAALDTMAREEIGIDPDELGGSPWTAALSSFFPFVAGAVVPIVPFALGGGATAVLGSAAASALALFAIGAAITLVTGRSVVRSGLRQVAFGLAAAAVTYTVGYLLGVAVTG